MKKFINLMVKKCPVTFLVVVAVIVILIIAVVFNLIGDPATAYLVSRGWGKKSAGDFVGISMFIILLLIIGVVTDIMIKFTSNSKGDSDGKIG